MLSPIFDRISHKRLLISRFFDKIALIYSRTTSKGKSAESIENFTPNGSIIGNLQQISQKESLYFQRKSLIIDSSFYCHQGDFNQSDKLVIDEKSYLIIAIDKTFNDIFWVVYLKLIE